MRSDALVFNRAVAQEGKLGFWRWLSMFLGIAGSYRKHETVDIQYTVNGKPMVATGLKPEPENRPSGSNVRERRRPGRQTACWAWSRPLRPRRRR